MKSNIYIISLSPAFDYILNFNELNLDKTNRPISTSIYPSGKGVHVSMLLNELKMNNTNLIFTNGYLEEYFYNGLKKNKINYIKFNSLGDIRINLKLIDKYQTECSVTSPDISKIEIKKMLEFLNNNVKKNDFVICTGSLPKNVDKNIYAEITDLVNNLGANSVIDSYGESLYRSLSSKPFLIKPNKNELSLTIGKKIETDDDIIKASKKLLEKGVKNILVSLGSEGAIFINNHLIIKSSIGNWEHKLINAAGSGDSMLAGFISNYINTNNFKESLKMGIICGSATAYSNKIANYELINELVNTSESMVIKTLKNAIIYK